MQLTIFDKDDTWISIYKEFLPIIKKLKKEFPHNDCSQWWHSRFHETVIFPGNARNKKGFEYEQLAELSWPSIWNRIK